MAAITTGSRSLWRMSIGCWSNMVYKYYGSTATTISPFSHDGILSDRNEVKHRPVLSEEDTRRFSSVYPRILSSLVPSNMSSLSPAIEHMKTTIEYTVPHGHQQRGLLTLAAYKMLAVEQSEEKLVKACIMGWCMEMLQACFVISDDMSDNSVTRRGKPCWFRLENVGLSLAVNDMLMLDNVVYQLLKANFCKDLFYIDVVDLFHEITERTVSGQTLDIWISNQNTDLSRFNQDIYETICSNKTALYTYYLPITLALHMVANSNKEVLEETEKICLQIGQLFQAKNDYSDCFGDPNLSGKIGTDIEEGKCTWLIVNALKLVNDEDRNLLEKCYGRRDTKMARVVYDKYVELQLDRLFGQYEKEMYKKITAAIGQLPPTCPSQVLYYCLDVLVNRP